MVLTDKDERELYAVKEIFKEARSLLCHFHVLQAVNRKLEAVKANWDFRSEVYNTFHECVYADEQDVCDSKLAKLMAIRKFKLSRYHFLVSS